MQRREDIENKVFANEVDFSTDHTYWDARKRDKHIPIQYDICHATYYAVYSKEKGDDHCLGCSACLYNFTKESATEEFIKVLLKEGKLTNAELLLYTLDGKLDL